MTSDINGQARTAREANRNDSGQFGHQGRTTPADLNQTTKPTSNDLRIATTTMPISEVDNALHKVLGVGLRANTWSTDHFRVADEVTRFITGTNKMTYADDERFEEQSQEARYLNRFLDTFGRGGRLRELSPHTSEHITAACESAGLSSMTGVYETMLDRGDDNVARRLNLLTTDQVEADYEQHIAPAIDTLESRYAN